MLPWESKILSWPDCISYPRIGLLLNQVVSDKKAAAAYLLALPPLWSTPSTNVGSQNWDRNLLLSVFLLGRNIWRDCEVGHDTTTGTKMAVGAADTHFVGDSPGTAGGACILFAATFLGIRNLIFSLQNRNTLF